MTEIPSGEGTSTSTLPIENDHKKRKSVIKKIPDPTLPIDLELEDKRNELIRLSEKGEISENSTKLKKATAKQIEVIHSEYHRSKNLEGAESISTAAINALTKVLVKTNICEEEIREALPNDGPFKKFVTESLLVMPWLMPYAGLISGGLCVAKHLKRDQQTQTPDWTAPKIKSLSADLPPIPEEIESALEELVEDLV